jgi:rubredoxin/uncharacterized damage-inducible protein DinB
LYRLARAATDAGYYNAAKVFYGAAASLINRQLYSEALPKTDGAFVAAVGAIEPQLAALNLDRGLLDSMQHVRSAITKNRIVVYEDVPTVFVCRVCGHVAREHVPNYCPDCGAGQLTFQNFSATYYLEPEPIDLTLSQLSAPPDWLGHTLSGLSASHLTQKIGGLEGEWSLLEAASHLLDAQQLIAQRVDRFMQHESPNLSAKAAYEMVDSSGLSAEQIAQSFRDSRAEMIERLRRAPSAYWARIGHHAEFGPVTLLQQVTYFAKHEQWHIAQMTRIRKAVSS